MPEPPPDHQVRSLTRRESQVLRALLERGTNADAGSPVTSVDRARWLAQVPHTLAGRPCACGTCPSIELTDLTGRTPATRDGRIVLSAGSAGALLLLFVDEDRLSYLELAPLDGDAAFSEFPDPADIDAD